MGVRGIRITHSPNPPPPPPPPKSRWKHKRDLEEVSNSVRSNHHQSLHDVSIVKRRSFPDVAIISFQLHNSFALSFPPLCIVWHVFAHVFYLFYLVTPLFVSYRDDNPQANVLLSFRIFSNLFLSDEGSALAMRHREKVSIINSKNISIKKN